MASVASNLTISAVVDSNISNTTKWIAEIKEKIPTWGSASTWHNLKIDNVVVNNYAEAVGLIKRKFQQQCNLYLPENLFTDLKRPAGVKLFKGSELGDMHNIEQVIAMHLVGASSDVVLLLGFDLSDYEISDTYQNHLRKKYLLQVQVAINAYPNVQWVCVDHPRKLQKSLRDLPNLTVDTVKNIKALLT